MNNDNENAFGEANSLQNINLEVEEGAFVVLFGPSGCGKTTLLRQLKPELTPKGTRSGSIFYKGRNLADLSSKESATQIGFVSQNPDNQIVADTTYNELAFGLENLGVPSETIRRRVAEMASFFGISRYFHKKTSELSGGQKQILNLASVLLMQPRLLLLDEPTAQLDPICAHEFISMVSRLNREFGITVILTEHKLDEVLPVSTNIAVMKKGEIKYFETPKKILGVLKENGEDELIKGMPAVTRIFSAVEKNNETPCPLNIKEGRAWLKTVLISENKLPKPEIKENKNADAVSLKDVTFKYSRETPYVLNGLSLNIKMGEIFTVLGENGSGKTTLLTIIAGLIKPLSGKVKINNKNINAFSRHDLYFNNIAFLPQNPKALFSCDKLCDDLKGCEETAKKLSLEPLFNKHPYDLSAGELQKAAFAKVLKNKPKILLLDEPTKGLDAAAKTALANLLLKLKSEGDSIIISTHDIEFAAIYADRCALIFDGSCAACGSPRQFFSGCYFYTTAANRLTRDIADGAVTNEDVVKLCTKKDNL